MVERAQRERPAQVVPPPARGLTRSRRLAIQTIRIYQRWISPRLKPRCLLEPSCSHYAALAVEHHGLVGGGIATARRLRRCVPANAGLIDYPEGVTVGLPHRQHRQGLHRQNA
jgi:putative membrane protein insertion efficiency factor